MPRWSIGTLDKTYCCHPESLTCDAVVAEVFVLVRGAYRAHALFRCPISQIEVVTMGEKKRVKDSPRGVVTYMSTSRTDDIAALTQSLQMLSKSFLAQHPYPVRPVIIAFSQVSSRWFDVLVGAGGADSAYAI